MLERFSPSLGALLLTLGLVPSLSACAAEQANAKPTPAPTATAKAAPPATEAAKAPAKPAGYTGLGLESVSAEQLAEFAAPALPAEVSRRIQAMLDVRGPAGGELSPDGKRLFFTWGVTGVAQVWRVDGPNQFPVQLTGGEDVTRLLAIFPDGKSILVARDRNGEENPGLYVQPADGGALTLVQHTPKVQTLFDFISEDGRWVYFHSNDVKPSSYAVYRWDRTTGKREQVFAEDGLWSVADHRPDGKLLLEKQVSSRSTEYSELDPATRKLTPLFGQGEDQEFQGIYAAQPGEVLVVTPKLSEFRRLYRWKGGTFTPLSPEQPHDVPAVLADQQKQRVLYTVNDGGYTRLHALDAKTYKELPLPDFKGADHVLPTSITPDGRFVALAVDPGTSPYIGYAYDWKAKKLTQWMTPSVPEIGSQFVRASLETYPARDGTKIPMLVRRPAKCTEPCPVVVSFHGGPEGQATPGFSAGAQLFVDAGFVYVEPNVRGSDGYGKTWFHADDGPKRLDVITDIEDAAKYIRTAWAKNGKAPKIGIYGGSYGGYSTMVGMMMFPGAYDAGVEVVGISNLLTFLQNTAPYRRVLRISEYGDPEKDREALIKLSPITYLDRIKAPMLMIQGANDPRVPVGEAVQMREAMKAKGIANRLIVFPDEGHGAQKRGNRALQVGHTVRFFEEHLLGKKE